MNGRKSFRRSDLEKLFDIQNDEKRSPSNIGGTGEKMGFGDDEFFHLSSRVTFDYPLSFWRK